MAAAAECCAAAAPGDTADGHPVLRGTRTCDLGLRPLLGSHALSRAGFLRLAPFACRTRIQLAPSSLLPTHRLSHAPPLSLLQEASDDDAEAEEEEEALRLQKEALGALRAEDFDQVCGVCTLAAAPLGKLQGRIEAGALVAKWQREAEPRLRLQDDDDEDDEPAAQTLGAAAKRKAAADKAAKKVRAHASLRSLRKYTIRSLPCGLALCACGRSSHHFPPPTSPHAQAAGATPAKRGAKAVVESVKKDLASLTAEEQAAAVMSDAPELIALANELRETLTEARCAALRRAALRRCAACTAACALC